MKKNNNKILTLWMRLNKSGDPEVRKVLRAEIERLEKVKEITMQNGKKYFIPDRT